ncbi:MAG: SH3 domain-containing protein [Pyrinomonadaceae bacterium]
MKNTHRNIIVLAFAICFTAFNFIGDKTAAQTRAAAKPTPTPKTKKSPTPIAKTTAKSTPKSSPKATTDSKTTKTAVKSDAAKTKTAPSKNDKSSTKTTKDSKTAKANVKPSTVQKPTPKPTATPQIIVAATSVRVRQKPATSSPQTTTVKLGKVLPVAEENAAWYRVEYADGKSGWILKTLVKNYDSAKRDEIYREIADRSAKSKTTNFIALAETADFLKDAKTSVKSSELQADLSLRWLRVLTAALHAIPFGKSEQNPYKIFLASNEKDVVYSEPSGEWYVRSDLFWELHGKFVELPVAEEIAWAAAQNPIPGECEGYVNCYLYMLRETDGEYLNFYPNGKYSKKALQNITSLLDPIVSDLSEKKVYAAPTDISDRAEFNRFLTELRTIISKVPDIEKNKSLQQISKLGEGYK